MKAHFKKRLLKLADFLQALPRKRFDYATWASGEFVNGCGTTACAFGWAATMPAFRRLGMRLVPYENTSGGYVEYRDVGVFAAGREIFGLTDDEFIHLFAPSSAPDRLPNSATPKQVARHIRKFVAVQG